MEDFAKRLIASGHLDQNIRIDSSIQPESQVGLMRDGREGFSQGAVFLQKGGGSGEELVTSALRFQAQRLWFLPD
jgi:hypothetical protein